jgi:hypothetical protein
VARAFRYYDRALRVSPTVAATILPAMAGFLKDENMVAPMALLLRRNPPWSPDLWEQIVRTPSIAANAARLRLEIGNETPLDEDIDRELIKQLVQTGEFALAVRLYSLSAGTPPSLGIASLSFARPQGFPPLDWQTFSEGGFSATVDPDAEALLVSIMSGSRSTVARKLLELEPGSYRVESSISGLPGSAQVSAGLRCADTARGAPTSRTSLANGGEVGSLTAYGGACRYYWLEIDVDGPTGGLRDATDLAYEAVGRMPKEATGRLC